MFAKDLTIGQPYLRSDEREPKPGNDMPTIKRLHEVCVRQPSPHVHIVTTTGEECRPFGGNVGRKSTLKARRPQRRNKKA